MNIVESAMDYVVYHAKWCPFCLSFMEFYRDMIPEGTDVVLESDSDPLWFEKDLQYVPTLIAMEDGEEVRRLGAKPGIGITRKMLEEWLQQQ